MSKRLVGLLALLLSLTLVVSACGIVGGDDEDDGAPVDDDPALTESDSADTSDAAADGDPEAADTTDDVAAEPAPATSSYSGPELSGLVVIDGLTFTVTLTEADPNFPQRLAAIGYAPLPSVFFDDPTTFEESPIGNGPFMMEGPWNHDSTIRVVANSNYVGPTAASLTSITFNIYESVCAVGYLYAQAATVDVSECVPVDQLPYVTDDFGGGYDHSTAMNLHYYAFPSYLWSQYPLELRRALSMAIDRQAIVDEILSGSVVPAERAVPPGLSESDEAACANWVHDPEGAAEAFEEYGGLETLGETPIVLWHGADDTEAAIAAAIAEQLDDVLGISDVQIESRESSEYLDLLDDHLATGPAQGEWSAAILSPLNFLEPLFGSTSSANSSGYSNARFDQAVASGDAAAAEAALCADVGIVPLYFGTNRYVSNLTVNNAFKDVRGHMNWAEMTGDATLDGVDIVAAIAEPQRLTPPTANDSEGLEVLEVLFSNLVEYDHRSRRAGNVVAESIETDDEGLTWTITLHDGWTFHNGERVTAYSFVDAWNWTANGDNLAANNVYFNIVDGWDAINS